MSNHSNYNDVYVNRVQLPSTQSDFFQNAQSSNEASRSSSSDRNDIYANLAQLPLSRHSDDLDSNSSFPNVLDTVDTVTVTVPSGFSQFVGQPPTYVEATTSTVDPIFEPPPSYDSLYGRVIEAQRQSKGFLDFAKKIFIIFLGTLQCSIVLCIFIVVPFCMIIIGSMFYDECPQGEYIPVYLIVGGIMRLVKLLFRLSLRARNQHQDDPATPETNQSGIQTLINWFMFAWFIMGSYWIYRIYEPNYDKSRGLYCDKTLYLVSFWLVSAPYIFLGLFMVSIVIIFSVCVLIVAFRKPTESSTV